MPGGGSAGGETVVRRDVGQRAATLRSCSDTPPPQDCGVGRLGDRRVSAQSHGVGGGRRWRLRRWKAPNHGRGGARAPDCGGATPPVMTRWGRAGGCLGRTRCGGARAATPTFLWGAVRACYWITPRGGGVAARLAIACRTCAPMTYLPLFPCSARRRVHFIVRAAVLIRPPQSSPVGVLWTREVGRAAALLCL